MINYLTRETVSVLLLHSIERKNDCHTLSTTSALVSVLVKESSSTYSTYANAHLFSQATKIHPTHSFGVSSELQPVWSQLSTDFLLFSLP